MLNFIKAMFLASAVILVILLGAVMKINRPIPETTTSAGGLTYPETRRSSHVDIYHDVEVPDPYRWLEDSAAGEVHAWIDAQNNLTEYWIDRIPERAQIKARLEQLWDYEKFDVPVHKGGRYFFSHQEGLQNQPVLYWSETLNGRPIELLNPNEFSSDGTVSLNAYKLSWDGRYLAYGLSDGGSDWQTWRVREVNTGEDLPDRLRWTKFANAAWTEDNRGFFYSRYPESTSPLSERAIFDQAVYYHKLGTSQSEDELIYHNAQNPKWLYSGAVTDDGSTLVLHIHQGTERKNRIYIKNLESSNASVVPMMDDFDAIYEYLGNEGSRFWFRTTNDASNGRVIEVDINNPSPSNWVEVIPESSDPIQSVSIINDKFIVNYLQDAHSVVQTFELNGRPAGGMRLEGMGTAWGFTGSRGDSETFYAYSDFITPPTIYKFDVARDETELFRKPFVDFDASQFEVKQIFYRSKDGTRVPMFIAHKKGIQLDGNNPTLLYGYGGFNVSLTPQFSVARSVWMEMGGVFALANIRGGGEYGRDWHLAGTKMQKQNVFDDFISAGEWLIDSGYTNSSKLAVQGGSNGGLLTGAVVTQRPDLFGAAIVQNGVLDMMRYHEFTIGWAWASDYGTSEDPEMVRELLRYSPVHNAYPGQSYPAVMVTTADHDDRVVPAHSYKFAAALQRAQASANPVLIRIQMRAGHGMGKPTSILIDEVSDIWAFLANQFDMEVRVN